MTKQKGVSIKDGNYRRDRLTETNYKKAMIKEKDDSMKKYLKIAVEILIATVVLCVFQYGIETYQKPVKMEVSYETKGCVIWGETYEIIPVEIKGREFYLLLREEAGTVMSEYWEKDREEPMLEGFWQMF